MKKRKNIRTLLLEDDARFAERLKRNLEREGFQIERHEGGDTALERLNAESFHLLLTDIKMPGMNGLEVLEAVKLDPGLDPELPVVMLTSIDDVETAVRSIRMGAADYIKKDATRDEIVQRIKKVLDDSRIRKENVELRERLLAERDRTGFVFESPPMLSLLEELKEIADTSVTILIQGETGAGKEVIAREIHRLSGRKEDDWVAINCAALPEDDKFQSEVFGHERGAFTGADDRKRGQFERAGEGTLLLDEVGELSLESQSKLLRVLETGEYTRMGGTRTLELQARVLVATNKDLRREVEEGRFRSDLYFRINVAPVIAPPLRERVEDVEPLALAFIQEFSRRYGKDARPLGSEALARLRFYSWPGNVREIRNVIEAVLIRGREGEISPEELRLEGPSLTGEGRLARIPPEGVALEDIERDAVEQALERTGQNRSAAARLLRISPDRLASRIKKFGLKVEK